MQEALGFAGCFFPEALIKPFSDTSSHQDRTKQRNGASAALRQGMAQAGIAGSQRQCG